MLISRSPVMQQVVETIRIIASKRSTVLNSGAALASAGASEASGGSPIPPQNPPLGASTASTLGMFRSSITG